MGDNNPDVRSLFGGFFDRARALVAERVGDVQLLPTILGALEKQQSVILEPCGDAGWAEVDLLHRVVRLSGFLAGIVGLLPPAPNGPRAHRALWYHLYTSILDALDDLGASAVDHSLLATLEVARGEICEAYGLTRLPDPALPGDCGLVIGALDLAARWLAAHLQVEPASPLRSEERSAAIRSKYSGSLERYPIDVRTCVLNDVRRYFPGQGVVVPDRVVQAVRATYRESLGGLVPEDTHLISGLLGAVPVLAFALKDVDFSPEAFIDNELSFAPVDAPTWDYAWTVSLDRMFFDDNGQPTEVAKRVSDSKEFGVFELLDGIVDSLSRPWRHSIQMEFTRRLHLASPAVPAGTKTQEAILASVKSRSQLAQRVDASFAWQQLGIYLDDADRPRVMAFSPWSLTNLTEWNEESQEHRLARGDVVQHSTSLPRDTLDRFEWLIGQDAPEAEFQRFLEENPAILLALGPYRKAVPHVILQQDDGTKLIPDFFLEVADRRGTDLLELKLPSIRLDVREPRRDLAPIQWTPRLCRQGA